MSALVQVRERPILMSAPMVLATLEGRKTQTRRIVTGYRITGPRSYGIVDWYKGDRWIAAHKGNGVHPGRRVGIAKDERDSALALCPYGAPGGRLWVRETWKSSQYSCDEEPQEESHACGEHCQQTYVYYRATPRTGFRPVPDRARITYLDESSPLTEWYESGWKPSIFMPRWASRLTLEITDVHVERLNAITEIDAKAEGVEEDFGNDHTHAGNDYRRSFVRVWDQINGRRAPWSENPWVWVIGFQRVKP